MPAAEGIAGKGWLYFGCGPVPRSGAKTQTAKERLSQKQTLNHTPFLAW